jgi:hypothetical protein
VRASTVPGSYGYSNTLDLRSSKELRGFVSDLVRCRAFGNTGNGAVVNPSAYNRSRAAWFRRSPGSCGLAKFPGAIKPGGPGAHPMLEAKVRANALKTMAIAGVGEFPRGVAAHETFAELLRLTR